MVKRSRKKFSKEQKEKAIDDYISGKKSAQEIAIDFETDAQAVYRWKTAREEKIKGARFDELINEGSTFAQAKKIIELELEIEEYKKKLAQEVLINELLKKLGPSKNLARENELTGLIRTSHQLDLKNKRVK